MTKLPAPARLRGVRWIESQRSPRYEIWVSNTEVASPYLYHRDCMALWDEALGRPVTELHAHLAREVRDEVAAAAAKLRARPDAPWSGQAAKALEWMRHLCACPEWRVRAETVTVASYYDLVYGVMSGAITADEAVRDALAGPRPRAGRTEASVRQTLNMIKSSIDYEPGHRGRR